MLLDLTYVACLGSLIWMIILLLPWQPWRTTERLEIQDKILDGDLSELTVLIPARNEADCIAKTMLSLNQQGRNLNIILIDDGSTDNTAAIAKDTSQQNLIVVSGKPLADGWTGKLWAMQQGSQYVKTRYVLLLDADIDLKPGFICSLFAKVKHKNYDLASVMVQLRMQSFWEKLLIPAFVYFFKLLYPFKLGNSPRSRIAVAAGGCILLKTAKLHEIGGFETLKSALIDDCTLAKLIKRAGGRTWMGLTRDATSHRAYATLQPIWDMVARTAFTQLYYSWSLLILCTALMLIMFCLPPVMLFMPINIDIKIWLVGGIGCMLFCYSPMLHYYRRHLIWNLFLPVIAILYLSMTWTSALRYVRGQRSLWKGRIYS